MYNGHFGLALPALCTSLSLACAPVGAAAQDTTTDWSGFSFGAHAGIGLGDYFGTFNNADAPISFDGEDSTQAGLGFQLGYTHQFDFGLTVGLHADMTFLFGSSSGSASLAGDRIETAVDYLALGQLRLGYAYDRFHFYGAGGLAFVDYEAEIFDAASGLRAEVGEGNAGVVLGGGVAWRATESISVFFDGAYILLDDENDISSVLPGADAGDRFAIDGVTVFRLGASYHF